MIGKVSSFSKMRFSPDLRAYSKVTKVVLAIFALGVCAWIAKRGWNCLKGRIQSASNGSSGGLRQGTPLSARERRQIENVIPVEPIQQVRLGSSGYPEVLEAVLKGRSLDLSTIPVLELSEKNFDHKVLSGAPYLHINPEEMHNPVMKGDDMMRRPFLAVRCRTKNNSLNRVDVFYCKNMDRNQWYLNECVEDFSKGSGSMGFLKELLENTHKKWERY